MSQDCQKQQKTLENQGFLLILKGFSFGGEGGI
jgi:hypothetical protein